MPTDFKNELDWMRFEICLCDIEYTVETECRKLILNTLRSPFYDTYFRAINPKLQIGGSC